MMIRVLAAAVTAMTLLSAPLAAEPLHPDEAFALTVAPDASGNLDILWDVQPGYYLYGSKIAAQGAEGPIPLTLPEGELYDDPWMGEDVIHRLPVSTVIPAPSGPVTLHWQGCQQDGICYAPQQVRLDIDATPLPEPARDAALPDWSSGGGSGLTLAQDQGIVAGLAGRGGAALVVLGFFGFGLMLSLTPCVLPMVPIVAGMLTRQGAGLTARRGLVLTGAYVTAMAAAFGMLGVVAAWSGANLQAALQSPLAIGLITGAFVLLALSMFGLFQIQMPAVWQARLGAAHSGRGTVAGAAALGFGSALIVGPCVTAPLAGALIYIAQTGDVVLGAAALFALGLGQGVPLLAVGAFGPRILPKRGAWMGRVRIGFGILFLALAIWLAGRILPGPLVLTLWAVLLIGTGAAIGGRRKPAAAAGLVLITGGVIQGVGAALGGDDPLRPLAPLAGGPQAAQPDFHTVTTGAGLKQALNQPGPALIYVTADWCVICRAIERGPMATPEVMAALDDLLLIKVDVTDAGTGSQAVLADLSAAGPPTMVFVDAARAEPAGTRLIGGAGAEAMVASARQVAP